MARSRFPRAGRLRTSCLGQSPDSRNAGAAAIHKVTIDHGSADKERSLVRKVASATSVATRHVRHASHPGQQQEFEGWLERERVKRQKYEQAMAEKRGTSSQ